MRYRIKAIREFLNMTREELAEKSGLSKKLLEALEDGSVKLVESETLVKLAQALGTSVEMLSAQLPPGSQDPLSKTIGYKTLLNMITPEDMQEARFLLSEFLHDFKGLYNEKTVLLAYLLGAKQRNHDIYGTDASGRSFAGRMAELYRMGKTHGVYETLFLLGKIPPSL